MYGYQPRQTAIRPRLQSYTSSFPLTENPISEGGLWQNSDPTNSFVQTTGGLACGTQTAADPFGPFNDSCAELYNFGANYEVEGIIHLAAGLDNVNREAEIHLRWSSQLARRATGFGDTFSNGYELSVQHKGMYFNAGRWKGANLFSLGDFVTPGSVGFTPANGDHYRARIEGQRMRMWWNDVLFMDFTDNDATLGITNGNPGIGLFLNAGPPFPSPTDFCYSFITVRAL